MTGTTHHARRARTLGRLALGLLVMLAGCTPALHPTPLVGAPTASASQQSASMLWGRVDAGRSTQALASDLLAYASISLLDSTNQVVATGLTDTNGAFSLNPFVSWTPTPNAVYALDALKSFDRTSDRAALRFRTLVSWDGTQWRSLAGSTTNPSGGSGVVLSAQTTALAAIVNLRGLSGSALLGSLNPASGAFTSTGGVSATELATVTGLVNQAIAANLDPGQWVTYANGTYQLRMKTAAGAMLFDLKDAVTGSGAGGTLVQGHAGMSAMAFSASASIFAGQFGGRGSGVGQLDRPMGVDVDRQGFVYVADFGNNRIQKFSPDGRSVTSIVSSDSATLWFSIPTDVCVDRNGNLLVTDYGNHRLQKLDPNGNFLFGLGGGGTWTGAAPGWSTIRNSGQNSFSNPHYAKFDPAGNFWVSDFLHNRMLKYDPNGNFLLGIAGGTTWTTPYQPGGLPSLLSSNYARTMAWGNQSLAHNCDGVSTDGTYVYVHDANATNGGFYKLDFNGNIIAGPVNTNYPSSSQGSLAYVNGRLYYRGSGTGANKISVINTNTLTESGYLLQDGTGTLASANNNTHPWGTTAGWMTNGLTTDGRYLYIPQDSSTSTTFTVSVYDPYNNMAWVKDVVCPVPGGTMNFDHHGFYSNGDYLFVEQYGSTTAPGSCFKFRLADGAYLGTDTIYDPLGSNLTPCCFDYYNQQILVEDHATGRLVIYRGVLSGTGNGWFNNQTGFAIAPNGDLYVCDRANNRVQRFNASGGYLGQWGTLGSGPGQMNYPEDAAIDQAGNVWISEVYNNRLQKFDRNGNFLGSVGASGAGNLQFNFPRGLAFAPDGSLYVGDWNNHRVQRLIPANNPVNFPAGASTRIDQGTVEFWIRHAFTNDGRAYGITGIGGYNGDGSAYGNNRCVQILRWWADNKWYFRVSGDSASYDYIADTSLIPANQWVHVAFTWKNGTPASVYVNGALVGQTPTVTTPSTWHEADRIYVGTGHTVGSSPSPSECTLDQYRLFDYPKSAEEIARDYRGLVQE